MKCVFCGSEESKVTDSRACEELNAIRRRRECLNCGRRFTTYETIELTPILVVKNDGSRQPFDINKVKNGMIKACEKRPVSLDQIEKMSQDDKFTQQYQNTKINLIGNKKKLLLLKKTTKKKKF